MTDLQRIAAALERLVKLMEQWSGRDRAVQRAVQQRFVRRAVGW